MSQLRFVAVSHFPPLPGGSARSCALLFRGMAGRGHEIQILASNTEQTRDYDRETKSLRPPSLSVDRYPVPYFSVAQYDVDGFLRFQAIEHEGIRQKLPGLIDAYRPKFVVCAHETLAGAVIDIAHGKGLACALMLRGSPTWQIVTDSYPEELTREYLALYRQADVVIPVGRYMQDGLEKRGVSRLHHIPNFLDLNAFHPGPREDALRDSYGIPRESVVALHPSLMQERKRPMDVLQSAAAALPKNGRLVYVFVGGSERGGPLEEAARKLGLGGHVRIVCGVPYSQMPAHIRMADMVVLASAGEGLARTYLEAQACGRTLISSDIPAGREVVEHERTGLLFRTGDPADLAAKVLQAAGDPELRRRIGEAAQKGIGRYDIERAIDGYEEVFGALRGDKTVSDPSRSKFHSG